MKEPNDKKKSSRGIKKPNRLYYIVGCFLANTLFKILFKRKKINRLPKLDSNFLVISRHSGPLDVAFMLSALYPYRVNLITGRDIFTKKILNFILKPLNLICKNQFALDINSIRTVKKAVDAGCNIGLYPEGKISIDGKNLHYIHPSIVKFIKFLNIPVVVTNVEGSYLVKPRWYKGIRFGKVVQTTEILISKEELTTLSNDEIYERVVKSLTYNDYEYQSENNLRFATKKPAKGVHTVLYKCPKCGAEYENYSTDTQLICKSCGNTAVFDEYGHIKIAEGSVGFERLDYWYDYQRKEVRKEINNGSFYIEKEVTASASVDNGEFKPIGEGFLYIDGEYIGYKGEKNGEYFEFKSSLKTLFSLIIKTTEAVDLTDNTTIYRFAFKDDKYSFLFGLFVEEYFRKLNNL